MSGPCARTPRSRSLLFSHDHRDDLGAALVIAAGKLIGNLENSFRQNGLPGFRLQIRRESQSDTSIIVLPQAQNVTCFSEWFLDGFQLDALVQRHRTSPCLVAPWMHASAFGRKRHPHAAVREVENSTRCVPIARRFFVTVIFL